MYNRNEKLRSCIPPLCIFDVYFFILNNQAGEHVMVVLTLKAGNHSEWNITLFINHTDLYTGPQNPQRLFYCYLPPNRSKCPDMNTKENNPARPSVSTLQNTTSAKPVSSSFKIEMSSTQKLNCQLPSCGYLFHYPENNQTAGSAVFPRTPTRNQSWWSVTTGVRIILVLVLVTVASTSAGCLVKDRRVYHRKSNLLTVSARDCQLKELSERRGNLTGSAPDAFAFGVDELSPIYEITENSLDEDCDDGEEEKIRTQSKNL
ncbi:uncharacterized protein si:dkey-192k22.2 isoform X2 [Triplophysa dalaica]|uniref:uncharacterized protein si:dkey-192k22.2 isoform X2 n=1 Tax=Triplophysa dalaica TaxID=1582913 RepID=UPI0024DF4145|nr:uncharacterized protein si:dkey-192k22.2 isoform X2 [Triplophysa dalaica]